MVEISIAKSSCEVTNDIKSSLQLCALDSFLLITTTDLDVNVNGFLFVPDFTVGKCSRLGKKSNTVLSCIPFHYTCRLNHNICYWQGHLTTDAKPPFSGWVLIDQLDPTEVLLLKKLSLQVMLGLLLSKQWNCTSLTECGHLWSPLTHYDDIVIFSFFWSLGEFRSSDSV